MKLKDAADLFSKIIKTFQSFEKAKQKAHAMEVETKRKLEQGERAVRIKLRKFKRNVIKSAIELAFVILSIVLILVGSILFLYRYLPLDLIFVSLGAFCFFIAMLLKY